MRHPRFKISGVPAFYHCYNRVAGTRAERPFGRVEKEKFVLLLDHLHTFYTVEVVAYQVMSNHFHLILHVPEGPPSPEETCRRYKAYYGEGKVLDPESAECERLGRRMADMSEYMGDLQQRFTTWFNRQGTVRRRGGLWADRFKNTLLDNGHALFSCWSYVEMNPVRAGMVQDPAEYRFCSYAAWAGTGKHPFAETEGVKRAFQSLSGLLHVMSMAELRTAFRKVFVERQGLESGKPWREVEQEIKTAGRPLPFHLELRRHSRYWVDGLVIGGELFVREAATRVRGAGCMKKRRLRPAQGAVDLCCFKTLRPIPG